MSLAAALRACIVGLALASALCKADAVTTRGGPGCATWLRNREADRQADFSDQNGTGGVHNLVVRAATLSDTSWLLGNLSGRAVESGFDYLANAEPDALYLWVDGYCQQRPLDSLRDASSELAAELRKRAKR